MTVSEMHYAVDQGLQKVGSYVYDTFLPEEIDFFLNKMQERFVKDRVFKASDPKRLGFSFNQKRLDDIKTLIEVDFNEGFGIEVSTVAPKKSYGLPPDTGSSAYMFLLGIQARIRRMHCDSNDAIDVPVRVVEQDKVHEMMRNPFMTSTINSPLGVLVGPEVIVYQNPKKFILKGVIIDYIRKPSKINLSSSNDCELLEHTHHEIVDMTVKHILEIIESPRYQTNAAEESQSD
jgi:hypothetical protein